MVELRRAGGTKTLACVARVNVWAEEELEAICRPLANGEKPRHEIFGMSALVYCWLNAETEVKVQIATELQTPGSDFSKVLKQHSIRLATQDARCRLYISKNYSDRDVQFNRTSIGRTPQNSKHFATFHKDAWFPSLAQFMYTRWF